MGTVSRLFPFFRSMDKTILKYTDTEQEFELKVSDKLDVQVISDKLPKPEHSRANVFDFIEEMKSDKEERWTLAYYFTDKTLDKHEVGILLLDGKDSVLEVLQSKIKQSQIIKNTNDKPLLPNKEFGTSKSGMCIYSFKNDNQTAGFEIIFNFVNGITLAMNGKPVHEVKPEQETETQTNDGFVSFRKWKSNEGSYTVKVPIIQLFERIGCTKENLTREQGENVLDLAFEPINQNVMFNFLTLQRYDKNRRNTSFLTLICGGKNPVLFKVDVVEIVGFFLHRCLEVCFTEKGFLHSIRLND